MSQKLRDLIRSVRACKTAGDERAVIAKESALIRTAFKEENNEWVAGAAWLAPNDNGGAARASLG